MVQLVYYPFNLHAVPGSQLALTFVIDILKSGDKTAFLKGRVKELGDLEVRYLLITYTIDSDLFLSWLFSDLLMEAKILKIF